MEKDISAWQLEKELRQLGLPTFMDESTKEKLLGKDPMTLKFEMKYDQFGKKKTVMIDLYLHKYDQLAFHVPAGFKATLKEEPVKSQTFPLSSELRIRAKEAHNLLQGRYVNKAIWNSSTNRFRNSWLRIDFNERDPENRYLMRELHLPKNTFQISDLLRDYPIQIQRPDELFKIMQSLYAGNVHRLEPKDKNPEHVTYIEAQPEKQQLQLYDHRGQALDLMSMKKDKKQYRAKRSTVMMPQEGRHYRKVKGRSK